MDVDQWGSNLGGHQSQVEGLYRLTIQASGLPSRTSDSDLGVGPMNWCL